MIPEEPGRGPARSELPEDASVTQSGTDTAAAATPGIPPDPASPPTLATTGWQSEARDSEQLGVFDAPVDDLHTTYDARSSYGQQDVGYAEPSDRYVVPAFVPPPAQPSEPAFLAGRLTRRPAATTTAAGEPLQRPPTISREEILPSWQIDGRYGAEAPHEPGGGGSRLDGVLTAIAVVAILALGVAAVLFLPGLLNKSPAHTPPPASFALPSSVPSALPSSLASIAPTIAPSSEPTSPASVAPIGSPRLYRIKPGDSLAHIANKFHVTVQQILDANPDIADPNHILVGQTIVIPSAPTATPSP